MKRFFTLTLSVALTLTLLLPIQAQGQITGHALYTEIVAQIDGHPVPSYNIGGRTAILVKDLADCGFYVSWDEADGAVYVWPGAEKPGGKTEPSYPEYVPQAPAGQVGTSAYPIYATDIKTYVAGEEKESFNIGGSTLIYLSDLTAYGEISWDAQARVAALTVTDDPVALALSRKKAQLTAAGLDWFFDVYPGPGGMLAVYGQYGTPHGTSRGMLYIRANGRQTDLTALFPNYGFGASFYLEPREIQFDEAGDISFITPVKETLEGDAQETLDWGDTLCIFNAAAGYMESMQPLNKP